VEREAEAAERLAVKEAPSVFLLLFLAFVFGFGTAGAIFLCMKWQSALIKAQVEAAEKSIEEMVEEARYEANMAKLKDQGLRDKTVRVTVDDINQAKAAKAKAKAEAKAAIEREAARIVAEQMEKEAAEAAAKAAEAAAKKEKADKAAAKAKELKDMRAAASLARFEARAAASKESALKDLEDARKQAEKQAKKEMAAANDPAAAAKRKASVAAREEAATAKALETAAASAEFKAGAKRKSSMCFTTGTGVQLDLTAPSSPGRLNRMPTQETEPLLAPPPAAAEPVSKGGGWFGFSFGFGSAGAADQAQSPSQASPQDSSPEPTGPEAATSGALPDVTECDTCSKSRGARRGSLPSYPERRDSVVKRSATAFPEYDALKSSPQSFQVLTEKHTFGKSTPADESDAKLQNSPRQQDAPQASPRKSKPDCQSSEVGGSSVAAAKRRASRTDRLPTEVAASSDAAAKRRPSRPSCQPSAEAVAARPETAAQRRPSRPRCQPSTEAAAASSDVAAQRRPSFPDCQQPTEASAASVAAAEKRRARLASRRGSPPGSESLGMAGMAVHEEETLARAAREVLTARAAKAAEVFGPGQGLSSPRSTTGVGLDPLSSRRLAAVGAKHHGPLEWQRLQESKLAAQKLAERAARLKEEAEAPARRAPSREASPEPVPEERPTTTSNEPRSPVLGQPMARQAQSAPGSADDSDEFQRMLSQTISPLQRRLAAVDDAAARQGPTYYERYTTRYRPQDGEEAPATPQAITPQATPPRTSPSPTTRPPVCTDPSVEPTETVGSAYRVGPTYHT